MDFYSASSMKQQTCFSMFPFFYIHVYIFLGGFLCIFAFVLTAIVTMLWSLIPGSTSKFCTRPGLLVKHKSRVLFSLVGSVTICSILLSLIISSIFWFMHVPYWGEGLKKLRRAEGGAKMFGVFRVKHRDFTPKKNHIFSNFRGGGGGARAGCAPLDPPLLLGFYRRIQVTSAPGHFDT